MNPSKQTVDVFIVSDATGITAERVIRAVLVQFDQVTPRFQRFSYVQSQEEFEKILNQAAELNAIVIHSLVSKTFRKWVHRIKREKGVYSIDLLGPLLQRLQRRWNMIPMFRPGIFKGLGDETYRLAESIDYTLNHDDGQRTETLAEADLIILGVSRTSKTPTSIYLSCNHCLKVANIPILVDQPLPEVIYTLKNQKIGFTIAPEKLATIRHQRMLYSGDSDYTDIARIREEVLFSHKIFRKIPDLKVIDVSSVSIEEIANKIV